MDTLIVEPIPCLKDNYAYLVWDKSGSFAAVVDPSEAPPVLAALKRREMTLTHILDTHHHADHVGGNVALAQATGAKIWGAEKDRARIPGLTYGLKEGAFLSLGAHSARVMEIPGHTTGHIAFWFAEDAVVFTGDTLFLMGCGRLFEGTAETMWASLNKLSSLPNETRIYCGHEYTQSNGRFALHVEPDNKATIARMNEVRSARALGLTTMGGTLAQEHATNPFLRARDARDFAQLRLMKDEFR